MYIVSHVSKTFVQRAECATQALIYEWPSKINGHKKDSDEYIADAVKTEWLAIRQQSLLWIYFAKRDN